MNLEIINYCFNIRSFVFTRMIKKINYYEDMNNDEKYFRLLKSQENSKIFFYTRL